MTEFIISFLITTMQIQNEQSRAVRLMKANGLLFCDLSDFTTYLNDIDSKSLTHFGAAYATMVNKMLELGRRNRKMYLANRMGDGFIWFDFNTNSSSLAMLDFAKNLLAPLVNAFLKSVKIIANREGLAGLKLSLLPGEFEYVEARLDPRVLGELSISRIDFLSPQINLAARINGLPESHNFFALVNEEFVSRLKRSRPEELTNIVALGPQKLKGLNEQVPVWGYLKQFNEQLSKKNAQTGLADLP